jgi:hypothetical protein
MTSLLTPQSVLSGGGGLNGKKRKLDADGELVGGAAGGGRKRRTIEGYGTDAGLYSNPAPDVVIIHMKEALPDNSVNSTAPKFHLKAASNELIRYVLFITIIICGRCCCCCYAWPATWPPCLPTSPWPSTTTTE